MQYNIFTKNSYSHSDVPRLICSEKTNELADKKLEKLKKENKGVIFYYEKHEGFWEKYGWVFQLGLAYAAAMSVMTVILLFAKENVPK